MPQFIEEITSVSHSLLCLFQDELVGPETQADCSNTLSEKQSFPQRVHDAAGTEPVMNPPLHVLLYSDCWD